MPITKDQNFKPTPFKAQANVVASLLKTNPILNEDEKASLNETVGVLNWLNQLQVHWADGGKDIPEDIRARIFEGRVPQKLQQAGA